jgi:monoamine oxidase
VQDRFDVVVIGAGAAGIAALRRLAAAPLSSVALEARPRVGGRVWTALAGPGLPLDLGGEWLHSADVNPLVELAEHAGFHIDRRPPSWRRQAGDRDFPHAAQQAFWAAYAALDARLAAAAQAGADRPAAELLQPGYRWNPLMDAVSTWYNGVELDRVSVLDYDAYCDTGVNWRVAEGYGAAIAHFADAARIVADCPVSRVRHDGAEVRLETPRGTVRARAAIVTVPTPLIAEGRLAFAPSLPDKVEAAAGLPLGLADKVFFGVEGAAADLPQDGHFFGRADRTRTGSYHTRPLGRPLVEAFIGGGLAKDLERAGPGAMTAFALDELTRLLGSSWRARLTPLRETAWLEDPWSGGSYSHALPGCAGARAVLARPVDQRLFFAGEATSPDFFSTAHGAWISGIRAAEDALAALCP